jgi:hypothetical protein
MVQGCGSAHSARFPERPAGCAVVVFEGSPVGRSEHIGRVSARCTGDAREACVRQLQDQACKLGGDIIWGLKAEHENLREPKTLLQARVAKRLP